MPLLRQHHRQRGAKATVSGWVGAGTPAGRLQDTPEGRAYRLPTAAELAATAEVPLPTLQVSEKLPSENTKQFDVCLWGYLEYGQLFSRRQLVMLQTLLETLAEIKGELASESLSYSQAVATYLGILIDRIAIANTAFGIWHTGRETLERPMGRQAFAMVFDYPESNPFCDSTGSAANQISWLTRFLEEESVTPFATICHNASSGDLSQFGPKFLDAVVTDHPYYDAIPYADLSDFFYGWMKRTLADVHPLNFAFPQTPKTEECTDMRYRHGGVPNAKKHFEQKLQQIFSAIERQTRDVVSIMFAHQSTEAWTTLCNSILGASMNITGSWANDTEMMGALKTDKAFLSSSVTVACRPVLRMEFFSEAVQDGKLIHETSYPQRPERFQEIMIGGSKIDFYDRKAKVVHEMKRGNKAKEAHVAQVKYYLWLLEQHGVTGATGILEYPRLRLRQTVELLPEDYAAIAAWEADIRRILADPTCPPVIKKPFCKNCAYYEFCYVHE